MGAWARGCVPPLGWLPRYAWRERAARDAGAGAMVGAVVVPQALAYASLAGLPEQYGLYAAYLAPAVYALLGTSNEITVGPTAIMSIMVGELGTGSGAEVQQRASDIILISMLAGAAQALAGMLRLGIVVNAVSLPVLAGFVFGATVTIATSQLSKLLGYSGVHVRRPFLQNVWDTASNLKSTEPAALALGLACIALILALKHWKSVRPHSRLAAAMGTSRNVVAVALGIGVCALLVALGQDVLPRVGDMPDGLPAPRLPELSWERARRLALPAASVALIGFVEDVAIAKSFARKGRYSIDPSQELVALGACNVLGGIFHAMPVTGSFSRTAVNHASGCTSPLAGIATSVTVLVAIFALQRVFAFIPLSALAAIIISAVFTMVDLHELRGLWKASKPEFLFVFLPTCAAGFAFGLQYAIFAGIVCAVPVYMATAGVPNVRRATAQQAARCGEGVALLQLAGAVAFPSSAKLEAEAEALRDNGVTHVVMDLSAAPRVDFSAAVAVHDLADSLIQRGGMLYVAAADNCVLRMLRAIGRPGGEPEYCEAGVESALERAAADMSAAVTDGAEGASDARGAAHSHAQSGERRRRAASKDETSPLLQV